MSDVRSQRYPGNATSNSDSQAPAGRAAVTFSVDVVHQQGTPFGLTPPTLHVVATCDECHEPLWPVVESSFVDHARVHEPELGR